MKKRFSRDRRKAAPGPAEAEELQTAGAGDEPAPDFDEAEDWEPEEAGEAPVAGGPDPAAGLVTLTVIPEESGRRLDQVLAARHPEYSRSQLARLAKEGLILAAGRPAKASAPVAAGQILSFPPPEAPPTDLTPNPEVVLRVLFEDEHLLAVDKPWGLVVHPAPGHRGPTLAGGLLARDTRLSAVGEPFRPGLVHRLDRDTSGVLVVAKTEPALRALAASFSQRQTVKRYLAWVKGRPQALRGVIDLPLGRHPTQRHKMAAGVAGGRPARTFYRVARFFPEAGLSLVLLTLVTGRTHQARVHLQSLGTPVLADPVYSRGAADLVQRFPQLAPYLQRQLLHARRLTVAHPATGLPVTFRAPWPEDFLGLWRELLRLERAGRSI